MKLLGWMHRKFRQNSNEPLKDFAIGNSCNCLLGQPSMDEHQFYPNNNNNNNNNKPSNYPNYSRVPHKHHPHFHPHNTKDSLRKSFTGLAPTDVDQDDLFDAHSAEELFHGLLAIGTLGGGGGGGGGDSSLAELEPPATPTFPQVSLDHVVIEKEAEVTENDLKLINEELEKVLGADAKDNDKFNDIASGRTSHVSSITLSGRDSNAVCPLQGYLFGSPIELPETTPANSNVAGAGAGKKEHRTSLGELFQRTKMVEDQKGEKDDKREMGEKNNVKKILKKRMLRSSTNGSVIAAPNASAATDPVSVSADTKFNKILQMFHRKVHPETIPCTKKGNGVGEAAVGPNYNKANKNETKSNDGAEYGLVLGPVHDEDIVIFPKGPICKQQRVRRYKCHASSASFALGDSDSNGNREHWIKTDADCESGVGAVEAEAQRRLRYIIAYSLVSLVMIAGVVEGCGHEFDKVYYSCGFE
ncbi:hypothetical protein Sjap_016543 [Stephania japonica]|uniref:Protein LAZY 1 n=1 Tax=Stephania japonica TaxID=461633 RepID=A0AAP0NV29_9MAGN